MSNGLQHKLYNQEVNPPQDVWARITAELDASHLADQFPATLRDAVVTPPAGCWDAISAGMDTPAYAQQLRDLEATPPAAAWSAIAAALDEETPAGIPANRNVIPWMRYAAAAAIIFLLAFGATRIFTGKQNDDELAITGSDSSTSRKNSDRPPVDTPVTGEEMIVRDDNNGTASSAVTATTLTTKQNDRAHRSLLEDDIYQSPASTISYADAIRPAVTYRDLPCSDVPASIQYAANGPVDMAGRYTLMMTPDGRIVRVSKKLGDMICCVSGEETSADCQDQLRKWRQTIADSPLAPSPGNFMDILDLVNTLQEKNL